MEKKVYKIEPLLNNSFDITLRELIASVLSDYDVKDISYSTSFSPDTVKVSEPNTYNFQPPKEIYTTFNFCSEKSWTNNGGHKFCECVLKDKLNIKFLRKMKLKQIENERSIC